MGRGTRHKDKEAARRDALAIQEQQGQDPIIGFQSYVALAYGLALDCEGVSLRFSSDQNRRVQIAVEITDNLTIDELRSAWSFITEWRAALWEWQGKEPTQADEFYEDLAALHGERSYAEIADLANGYLSELLRDYAEYADYIVRLQNEHPDSWLIVGEKELSSGKGSYFRRAKKILSLCKPSLDEHELDAWLHGALENIRNGHAPFLPDTPVSKDEIYSRIRYWREKNQVVEKTG